MFVSGVEIHGTFSREDKRTAVAFLLGATILPFLIGLAVSRVYDFSAYAGPNSNPFSLSIIIGIAVAVTSIPVISKIFLDLKIMDSRYARIVLAIATVEDSILYAGLAIATGVAGASTPSTSSITLTIALTVAFLFSGLLVLPRILRWLSKSKARFLMETSHSRFALFLCFLFVAQHQHSLRRLPGRHSDRHRPTRHVRQGYWKHQENLPRTLHPSILCNSRP